MAHEKMPQGSQVPKACMALPGRLDLARLLSANSWELSCICHGSPCLSAVRKGQSGHLCWMQGSPHSCPCPTMLALQLNPSQGAKLPAECVICKPIHALPLSELCRTGLLGAPDGSSCSPLLVGTGAALGAPVEARPLMLDFHVSFSLPRLGILGIWGTSQRSMPSLLLSCPSNLKKKYFKKKW